MNSKHIKLINILLKNGKWTTADVLSVKTNMSARSVKKYISEINCIEKDFIQSSRNGYQVDNHRALQVLEKYDNPMPITQEERAGYILKELLSTKEKECSGVDLYELSDTMCVSVETIRKDLAVVRKKLKDFDLFLHLNNDVMCAEGKELDKRKMHSCLIYEEFSDKLLSMKAIEKVFIGYDINTLISILIENCKEYQYFINEYVLMNLVLDLIILIDRIKNNFTASNTGKSKSEFGIRERSLATKIVEDIEMHYEVIFNEFEINELTTMLISCLMKIEYESINYYNLGDFVGQKCMDIMEQLKEEMSKYGFIDIKNMDFIVKFTIHLKNLLLRLQNNYIIKNPILNHIRVSCPLIFECAVAVSQKLREITGFFVDEHETSYIALHIGGLLGYQTSLRNKASCILLFPQYYDYSNKLISRIMERFESNLVVNAIITSFRELESVPKEDFIITTIQLSDTFGMNSIYINPFLTDRDILNIQTNIDRTIHKKKQNRLKNNLLKISNPKFFFKNKTWANEKEAITFMVNIMKHEGYVEDEFLDEVMERERNYSTAFGNIAIPHSMRMNARKTGMFILINDKAFVWGESLVNMVVLFAINYEERSLFYDILDNLIDLLMEDGNINKVVNCCTYKEFTDFVIHSS